MTERMRALELLGAYASNGSHEAALYKAWLELSIGYSTPKRKELVSQLRQEFRRFGRELRQREVYQVVADTLACDSIDNNQQDEAIQLFRDELDARKATTRIPWLRPPQKSRLYWMFYVLAIQDHKVANRQDVRLEAGKKRLDFNKFRDRLKNDLYDVQDYRGFQMPDGWEEVGVFSIDDQEQENKMRKMITEEMLPNGWRY